MNWLKQNKLAVIIAGVALVITVLALLGLKLAADAEATKFARQTSAQRNDVSSGYKKLANTLKTEKNAEKLLAEFTEFKEILQRQQTNSHVLGQVAFGETFSQAYAKAAKNKAKNYLSNFISSAQQLEGFGKYQQSLKKVLSDTVLYGAINSQASAKTSLGAWQKAAAEMKKVKSTENSQLNNAHQQIEKHIANIAAFLKKLSSAYEKNDQQTIKTGQKQLETRLANLRRENQTLQKIGLQLENDLQNAAKQYFFRET